MSAGGGSAATFVWIRLANAAEDAFAKIFYTPGQDVGDVAVVSCRYFSRWGLDAGQVRIHLVAASGTEEPSDEAISAALAKKHLSVGAAVASGAWLVAATQHVRASPASSSVPGRLSFGGGGGGGGSPAPPEARLPSVSEAVGPTFEQEARDAVSALFRELCPWTNDHSPLLSRRMDTEGARREAGVVCYVHGDDLLPCVALAGHGACLAELPGPALPALPPLPLPAGERFSPSDATRMGPHKYFLAETYSGQNEDTWAAKAQQLDTLCDFLKLRWTDRHPGAPAVTDVTQIVGAAALVFSAGASSRKEVLRRAQELVTAHVAGQCPNLARLAAAGRLVVIVLDRSQAPITLFQRSVAAHLESIPELRREVEKLSRGVAALLLKR
jgi:hypothetical protein